MNNAILTIHDIYNYGSVLQAYASQRVLQNLSGHTRLIDYAYPQPERWSVSTTPRRSMQFIKSGTNRLLKDRLPGRPYTTYKRRYALAKGDWFNLTKRYDTLNSLREDPPDSDTYISGSDQVWHPRSAGKDHAFFLDFAPEKARRISFASSFGVQDIQGISADLIHDYARLIDRFEHITVREASGVKLIKDLCGRKAQSVLDPTLILSREDWLSEATAPIIDGDYILGYGISPHKQFMPQIASELSNRTGWPIVFLNGNFLDIFQGSRRHVLDAGPREFLSLIANARMVLGQSFHATAFATNFGVPFLSILRGEPNHDSRQRDFLDNLGLGNRCIQPSDDVERFVKSIEAIDFDVVSQRLDGLRSESIAIMSRILAKPSSIL